MREVALEHAVAELGRGEDCLRLTCPLVDELHAAEYPGKPCGVGTARIGREQHYAAYRAHDLAATVSWLDTGHRHEKQPWFIALSMTHHGVTYALMRPPGVLGGAAHRVPQHTGHGHAAASSIE